MGVWFRCTTCGAAESQDGRAGFVCQLCGGPCRPINATEQLRLDRLAPMVGGIGSPQLMRLAAMLSIEAVAEV